MEEKKKIFYCNLLRFMDRQTTVIEERFNTVTNEKKMSTSNYIFLPRLLWSLGLYNCVQYYERCLTPTNNCTIGLFCKIYIFSCQALIFYRTLCFGFSAEVQSVTFHRSLRRQKKGEALITYSTISPSQNYNVLRT